MNKYDKKIYVVIVEFDKKEYIIGAYEDFLEAEISCLYFDKLGHKCKMKSTTLFHHCTFKIEGDN